MSARALALALFTGVLTTMSSTGTSHAAGPSLPRDCRIVESPGLKAGRRDGTALYCPRDDRRELAYHLHLPPAPVESAPVLVAVHGISRNAREQAAAFGARAARLGLVTVAPVFTRKQFPAYQRLGHSRRGVVSFPHLALESVLEEVALATGADTARSYLFGFSGGAQFAHRYAMRYPDRVRAVALGSAGWYTFPDVTQPFPRGIGPTPLAQGVDPLRFLRVPALVLVGERDDRRDASLNTSRAIDVQQGPHRIERARRWTAALRSLAQRSGIEPRAELIVMPRCGHDFGDCVRDGSLVERVLEFFAAGARASRETPRESASPLLFSAGR